MARVLTTFVTRDAVIDAPFRSVTPKRAILKRHVNDTTDTSLFDPTISDVVEFPFGPKDLKYSGMTANMSRISRPGKKPLLEKENETLRSVSFNAVVANKQHGGTTSVIPTLQSLEMLATSGAVCSFTYGTTKLGYNVCLTTFDYTVKYRNAEGEPVRVDASIGLTEKPVFTQELIQLDVIPYTPPPAKPVPVEEMTVYEALDIIRVSTNYPPAMVQEAQERIDEEVAILNQVGPEDYVGPLKDKNGRLKEWWIPR